LQASDQGSCHKGEPIHAPIGAAELERIH
jgi:hypothetical protein